MTGKQWQAAVRHRPTPIAAAAALLALGIAAPGQAQQNPPAGEQLKLETVVVSANRRIEKLEDVPQSITVLGEEYMQRNNVREFNDIVNPVSYTHLTLPTKA